MELAATEFQIQGLELDWVGLCWDADLRVTDDAWQPWRFKGTKWQRVRNPEDYQYIFNKYRVLLTRAREGMIIWVPQGDVNDSTRDPRWYDCIAERLTQAGLTEW